MGNFDCQKTTRLCESDELCAKSFLKSMPEIQTPLTDSNARTFEEGATVAETGHWIPRDLARDLERKLAREKETSQKLFDALHAYAKAEDWTTDLEEGAIEAMAFAMRK